MKSVVFYKGERGFTFVELLVVVTIIALLMGAASVSYVSTSKRSRDAKRLSDMEVIRSALEICRSEDGEYPASINYGSGGITCTGGSMVLTRTPADPKSSACSPTPCSYSYSRPTVTTYTLGCTLEGGESCSYTQP